MITVPSKSIPNTKNKIEISIDDDGQTKYFKRDMRCEDE